jgi:tetratricopeptide (TPR) repeat protein
MDPDMMKFATEMMNKMSPEQLAEMQRQAASLDPTQMQQAMRMFENLTPEQKRSVKEAASTANPDAFVRHASSMQSQLSAQQKYQYDASARLKGEGNKLHGQGKYKEASERYQTAVNNLETHTSPQSTSLRTSCYANLASCYLQLELWKDCISACNAVLKEDENNRKALYRRGQAVAGLDRVEEAVSDLQRALTLSPDSEHQVIEDKLKQVEAKMKQNIQPAVTDEVTDQKETEAVDEITTEKNSVQAKPAAAVDNQPSSLQIQQAVEMMNQDPQLVAKVANMLDGMSDAELAEYLAQQGASRMGATPEMARMAASMMKVMSPEELKDIASKAESRFSMTPLPERPQDPAATAKAAARILQQDPNALKTAAKMIQQLPPEQLQAMAASMPQSSSLNGMTIDSEQMRSMAKMMESMSSEDFERMTKLAESMTTAGPQTRQEPRKVEGQPSAGDDATEDVAPRGSVPGAAPRYEAGRMSENFAAMRRQMADPEMLKSMQSMLKAMDPEMLSSMLKSSGMSLNAEQVQRMVNSMSAVNERQLEWLARAMAVFNASLDLYQRMKAWVLANVVLTIAILALLIYLFLRWIGKV